MNKTSNTIKLIALAGGLVFCIILSFYSITVIRDNNLQEYKKNYDENLLSYRVTQKITEYKYGLLITISDIDGIIDIECPDGKIINANKKSKISMDYIVETRKNYDFKIKKTNGEIITKTLYKDLEQPNFNMTCDDTRLYVQVTNNYMNGYIQNFNFYVNDNLISTTTEKMVSIQLTEQTIYNAYVIANFNNGENITSYKKEIKSDEKLFLYNNGNQYNSLTGGYSFNVLQNNDVQSQYNSNYLYMYALSRKGVGYGELELTTNNGIDISEYSNISFIMDYSVKWAQEDWRVHFYYGIKGEKSRIVDVPGTVSETNKVAMVNIDDFTGLYKPYFKIYSASCEGPAWAKIKAIWLVKERIIQ